MRRQKTSDLKRTILVQEAPRNRELTQVHVTVSESREETLAKVERAELAFGARVSNDSVHNVSVLLVDNANQTTTVIALLVGAAVLRSVKSDNVVGVGAPPTAVTLAHSRVVPSGLTTAKDVAGVQLLGGSSRDTGDKGGSGKNNSTRELHLEYRT